jgi:hypothetical protein
MALWKRTARPATAAWISITTVTSGPSVVLREHARTHRIAVLETVNFDDRTAAISPRIKSIARVHGAGHPLPLTPRERRRLTSLLVDLHGADGVTDIVFETHLPGTEDAEVEQHFPLHALLEIIEHDGLAGGVRYVTD